MVERRADEAVAEAVADGVWRLVLPLPYENATDVNCWLLEYPDGWCLVDCGTAMTPGWDALEHALAAAGASPDELALLVCTHSHADHYGLAAEIRGRTGCTLALAPGLRAAVDVMRDPIVPLERRLELTRLAGVPEGTGDVAILPGAGDAYHPRPEPDLVLESGDLVEAAGTAWRVVPALGHCCCQF